MEQFSSQMLLIYISLYPPSTDSNLVSMSLKDRVTTVKYDYKYFRLNALVSSFRLSASLNGTTKFKSGFVFFFKWMKTNLVCTVEWRTYMKRFYHGSELLPRKFRANDGLLQPSSMAMRLRRTFNFSVASSSNLLIESSDGFCGEELCGIRVNFS